MGGIYIVETHSSASIQGGVHLLWAKNLDLLPQPSGYFCGMNRLGWLAVVGFSCVSMGCGGNDVASEQSEKKMDKAAIAKTEALGQAVLKRPDSVGLRFNYITALDSIGQYKTALQHLDSLIIKDKGNFGLWYKKGQVCEHAGDTANAIVYYNTAIDIYPAPHGLLALANLYAETKNAKALEICNRIDELNMGREFDAYSAFFAGVYFSRTGKRDKAIPLFDKSIANSYTFMDAYIEKGGVFYDDKKYNEAMGVFATAISVNNRFADAYYWQGKCLEAMQKKSDALLKYQQSLTLNPELLEAKQAIKRLQ